VRHISPITTAQDLAQVAVEGAPGLTLGDVANVVEEHQPLIGTAVGSDLVLIVEKFPNANTLAVTQDIEERIETLRPGLAGVDFDQTVYRPATFIDDAIGNVVLTLIIAGVIIGLAIGAFFLSWRKALVSFVSIPLSVITAGLVLYLLGASINSIFLVGLVAALLVVVDDATIDVEAFSHRLRERTSERGQHSAADIILVASEQLRSPMLYAAVIMALAAVPLLFFEGVAGAFLPDVLSAYLVAIAVSLVVALTLTPALSFMLTRNSSLGGRESPVASWLRRGYGRVFSGALRRPSATYLAVGAIVLAGIVAVPFLNHSSLPQFKETELLLEWSGPPGMSLPESDRVTAQVAGELRAIPGVRSVQAQVGRAVTSDRVTNVDSGELWISVDQDADYEATIAGIERVAAGYPGFESRVVTYSNAQAQEVLADPEHDLTVRVFGPDLEVLRTQTDSVLAMVSATNDVTGARVDLPPDEPTIEVEVDLAAAQAAGVKPGDVRRAAAILLSGINVGSLFEEQKVFDVVVWGVPDLRRSVSDVLELPIETPLGDNVPLGSLADVRVAPNPTVIRHESVSRYMDITADIDGRSIGSVEREIKRAISAMAFPLEYHAEVVSTDEGVSTAVLIGIILAAVVGAFLLMQASFGNWRHATLAFVAVPMGLSGGAIAILASGRTASLGSIIGLFAVGAIAMRHAMLLISRCQQLEHGDPDSVRGSANGEPPDGRLAFGPELVRRAVDERVAPLMLTTLAIGLATLPILIRGGLVGHELLQPLAIVLLGGVVSAALVNLFVVPLLYLRLGPSGALISLALDAVDSRTAGVRVPASVTPTRGDDPPSELNPTEVHP